MGDMALIYPLDHRYRLNQPSVGMTKTNNVSTLTAGTTTTYTITVVNDGPGAADGSIVKDPVSPGCAAHLLPASEIAVLFAPLLQFQ